MGDIRGFFEAIDDGAFGIISGIAVGCHDDADGSFRGEADFGFAQAAGGAGKQGLIEVGVEAHHQALGFRVAEANIVFKEFRAVFGEHEACEEDAFEGCIFFLHGGHGGQDNGLHDLFAQGFGHDGRGGVSAHAAGVGAGVAVADAFVVLGVAEFDGGFPIGEGEVADFGALHKFFDDDGFSRCAEGAGEHIMHGGFGFLHGLGDDDAFAASQAIGFDNDGGFLGF